MLLTKERHQEHKMKQGVQSKLNRAIAQGKMKRLPCAICSNPKSEGHHIDYTKPYEVIFLCRLHHKGLHAQINRRRKDNG